MIQAVPVGAGDMSKSKMVKWAQQMNCGCDTCKEGERFVNNLSGLSHKEQDWMVRPSPASGGYQTHFESQLKPPEVDIGITISKTTQ